MSSGVGATAASGDDRSTKARIRDAAVECFAQLGPAATTARAVAEAAGVSPGLVMHHFGSMDGLRSVCDDHVVSTIRAMKQEAMVAGPSFDLLGALRDNDLGGPLAAYLSRVLVTDSPAVDRLVDEMVTDAEVYLQQGVESGMLIPTDDPRGRAAVLALWSLGVLVLHRHLDRLLGVDLTQAGAGASPAIASYLRPAYEIMGGGILTEETATALAEAMSQIDPQSDETTKG